MGPSKIDQILVTPLKKITVSGGDVFHGLKNTDSGFDGFGELYFSWIHFNQIKAWKRHTTMTMNLIVPDGKVQFAFFESEDAPQIKYHTIGVDSYSRLTIPPGIWFGFRGLAEQQSLIVNLANILHDPGEVDRLPENAIYFDWEK